MAKKTKREECPGFYEVSGYTTSDGKKVDSYTRQCWKHGGSGFVRDEDPDNDGTIYTPEPQKNPSDEILNFEGEEIGPYGPKELPTISIYDLWKNSGGEAASGSNIPNSDSGSSVGEWLGSAIGVLANLAAVGGDIYSNYFHNKKDTETNFSSTNLTNSNSNGLKILTVK